MESLEYLPKLYFIKSIPNEEYAYLTQFLTYVVPAFTSEAPLSFAVHLGAAFAKSGFSMRKLGLDSGVSHSEISRLLSNSKIPKLATAARIIESLNLSDAQAFKIVVDSIPLDVKSNSLRSVFADAAPQLRGSFREQLKGYRQARDLSIPLLAARAKIDRAFVWRVESEGRPLGFITFAALVSALGLNPKQVRGCLIAAANQ
ncbi:MAG TPA: helix-turn-helix transcriptional regulator [Patescibacteria group bacterium]|jgi:transcriptional regulator with XRE-family HTH domain|nr:helix-turn-helix transcriptional regulator [Patescibacteria group bacterium]